MVPESNVAESLLVPSHGEGLEYCLIDSGDGRRLERYGQKTLIRPSSLCMWRPRRKDLWGTADAEYVPDTGWKFRNKPFECWDIRCRDVLLRLRLQSNGQIGFFPDHALYIESIETIVRGLLGQGSCRILNLFAYTGLATLVALKLGASVTHVDLAKRALDWFSENLRLNNLIDSPARIIRDDALDFLRREVRRGGKYDVIIVDPPSFSRISGKKSWTLDEVLPGIVYDAVALLPKDRGALFLTCHNYELGGVISANIVRDALSGRPASVEWQPLLLPEENTERSLPGGNLVIAQFGIS